MSGTRKPSAPSVPPCRTAAELATALRGGIREGRFAPGTRLPTLQTLARESGLSYKTVQRGVEMLARDGLVAARRGAGTFVRAPGETSIGARPLRLGVAPPFWGDSPKHFVFSAVMQGMCEEAQRLSHRIELVHMRGGDLSRWETADVLGARGLDALICIQPPQVFPVALVRLVERGLPVVLTGRGFVGLPVPVVRDDVEAGARLVADWMAERGRTRLVALVGHRADLHTRPRIDALRRTLRERGLDLPGGAVRTLYFGGPEPPYGYENDTASMRAHRFLREAGGFDAVFTMSTPSLRAVARYREAECRDLSVVHLEQADVPARQACPGIPVSLLAPPLAALGREAIRVTESQCGIDPEGESPSLAPTLDPAP